MEKEMEKLVKKSILRNTTPGELTWGIVLLIAMNVVEEVAAQRKDDGPMLPSQKEKLAEELVNVVIKVGEEVGYLTYGDAIDLRNYVTLSATVLESLVDAFHYVKTNPSFIQWEQVVKTHCCPKISIRRMASKDK